ncbi:hypothetical protein [Psychrobacter vallis]|uniref:hypothetical protein n=1 Tax=Psychrobacter vallis TaxID=248451 RepID=UPI001918CCB5|nr:hypothetical protein [Psychrobacter vallis]
MLPLPEPLLITNTVTTPFLYPRSKSYLPSESWELGGVALSDSSEDLDKYVWRAWTDGSTIKVQRDDLETYQVVLMDSNVTDVDLTFDQNMRPCIAYVANGISKLYWYDTQQAMQVITEFPLITSPRVSLDDKRRFNVANSDIIFAYQKGDTLCYRLQRERFTIEHVLATNTNMRILWRIGMGTKNRFLFYWR